MCASNNERSSQYLATPTHPPCHQTSAFSQFFWSRSCRWYQNSRMKKQMDSSDAQHPILEQEIDPKWLPQHESSLRIGSWVLR